MKKIYSYIKQRWNADTPARAKAVKAVCTWIAAASISVAAGYDLVPESLKQYIPQSITTAVAVFAFIGRAIAGLKTIKQ